MSAPCCCWQSAPPTRPKGTTASYDPRVLLDRSYFQLQAKFAARVAAIEGLTMGEAFRLHTAFYALARDNDAGVAPERNDFDPAHPAWAAFLNALEDGVDPVSYVYEDYLSGDAQEDDETTCFGFTYWPEDQPSGSTSAMTPTERRFAPRRSTRGARSFERSSRRSLKRIRTLRRCGGHPGSTTLRRTEGSSPLPSQERLGPSAIHTSSRLFGRNSSTGTGS